jgi:hypothetical protein
MLKRTTAIVLTLLAAGTSLCRADTPAEFKDLEKMVVKLFEAYNKDDAKGVFADYISTFKALDATTLYNSLFKTHKENFGNYKSHVFVKEGSVKQNELALLVLDATFEKKKGKISINFGKDEGKLKIQQVTFEEAK